MLNYVVRVLYCILEKYLQVTKKFVNIIFEIYFMVLETSRICSPFRDKCRFCFMSSLYKPLLNLYQKAQSILQSTVKALNICQLQTFLLTDVVILTVFFFY